MNHVIDKKQQNTRMCFVCGLKNNAGLKASFYETEGHELVSVFTPKTEHQSYPGRLHGGIASTIIDETICRAIMIGNETEIWGVTLELNLQYKKPVPLDREVKVVGRVTEDTVRFFRGTAEIILDNGDVAVTAQGRYMKVPLAKIDNFDPVENEWQVVINSQDPALINY